MGISSKDIGRLQNSTPDLDAAEAEWWRIFAEMEERFCWVQTPALQQYLRGEYLRDIVRSVGKGNRVVELGCGTGWLCILLAGLGCRQVVGYDFSATQIQIARERAKEAGLEGKVTFVVADAAKLPSSTEIDAIIIHAFLHHLSVAEITCVVELAHRILRPDGKLIVVEPVLYPEPETNAIEPIGTRLGRKAFSLIFRIARMHGPRRRFRSMGSEERAVRNIIAQRPVGVPPRGVSPKEMPFGEDELPALLQPRFSITRRRRCIVVSHQVAQELLLLRLTYPRLGKAIFWPIVWAGRLIDRWLLSCEPPPSRMWIFEMFECVRMKQ